MEEKSRAAELVGVSASIRAELPKGQKLWIKRREQQKMKIEPNENTFIMELQRKEKTGERSGRTAQPGVQQKWNWCSWN